MSVKTLDSNRRADRTRKAILRAAIREFSAHGLAGARTDAIAESAKVNKALLYYYFKSKSGLYAAAIEEVSGTVVERALAALDPGRSAGDRLLRTALNHFDRILTQRDFQSLMQQEMVRVRRGESDAMPVLVKNVFKPLLEKLQEAVHEGIRDRRTMPDGLAPGGLFRPRRECSLFSQRAHDAPHALVRPNGERRHRVPPQGRGAIPRQRPVCGPRPWSQACQAGHCRYAHASDQERSRVE